MPALPTPTPARSALASRALVLRDSQPPERQRGCAEQRGYRWREPGRPGRQPKWIGTPEQIQRGRIVGEPDRDDEQKDAANPSVVDAQRVAGGIFAAEGQHIDH